jgi:hypothetical protein
LWEKTTSPLAMNNGGTYMAEEDGAGVASNMIWAVALIVIVLIIFGALYYGGVLSGKQKKEIDVDISAPVPAR